LGLKFIQNFRVEAERRLSRILEKSSSLVENPHQLIEKNYDDSFFIFSKIFGIFLKSALNRARVFLLIRAAAGW